MTLEPIPAPCARAVDRVITAGPEPWGAFLPELHNLIGGHYLELALDRDKVPLMPRWGAYDARDRDGSLMLIVARHAGEAAGYFIGFVAPHMHYETCLTLLCDIFYVVPRFRGSWAGVRLFKATEAEAKRRGVQRMVVTAKLHNDAGPLLRFLKFRPIETVYSKWIGAS